MKSSLAFFLVMILSQIACKKAIQTQNSGQQMQNADTSVFPGSLVHMVYFDLRDTIKTDSLLLSIGALKDVDAISTLTYGCFKDLGDIRAIEEYDAVMIMSFSDESKYQNYQNHPLHLHLKRAAEKWLAGPPLTYDFISE